MLYYKSKVLVLSILTNLVAHGKLDNVIVSSNAHPLYTHITLHTASVYRVPLKAPAVLIQELTERGRSIEDLVRGISDIRHPLVIRSSPKQLFNLLIHFFF